MPESHAADNGLTEAEAIPESNTLDDKGQKKMFIVPPGADLQNIHDNQLPAAGEMMVFGQGIWQGPLEMWKGITLQGAHHDATDIRTATGDVLIIQQGASATIEKMGIRGIATGIKAIGNRRTYIDKVRIWGCEVGIWLANSCFWAAVHDSMLEGCATGLRVTGGAGTSNSLILSGLKISGFSLIGIQLESTMAGILINPSIEGGLATAKAAIVMDDCEGIEIVGLQHADSNTRSLWIGGPYAGQGQCRNINIRGGVIRTGCTTEAIRVHTAKGLVIEGISLLSAAPYQIVIEDVPETIAGTIHIRNCNYKNNLVYDPGGKAVLEGNYT